LYPLRNIVTYKTRGRKEIIGQGGCLKAKASMI